jgi:hypothetical protein
MTRLVGVFVGIVVILFTLRGAQAIVADNRATASTPLHGIWDVETVERNGKRVALTIDDDRLWRRLVFPFRGTKSSAILVWMSDAVTRYRSAIDADAAIIELDPIAGNTVSGSTRGRPSAAALVRQVFSFSQPDPDHLMLEGRAPDGTALLIRLRKFDPEAYLLISHRPQWRW